MISLAFAYFINIVTILFYLSSAYKGQKTLRNFKELNDFSNKDLKNVVKEIVDLNKTPKTFTLSQMYALLYPGVMLSIVSCLLFGILNITYLLDPVHPSTLTILWFTIHIVSCLGINCLFVFLDHYKNTNQNFIGNLYM